MAGDETEGMRLPLELLDTIVDELATNKMDSPDCELALLNCALVCRSFYTRASAHIFATIVFVSGTSDVNDVLARKLEDLHAILERNGFYSTAYQGLEFLDNPHLPLILDKCSSISEFKWTNHNHPFRWEAFGSPIHRALRNLVNGASLTSLSFSAIQNIPVDLILGNPNLKHLSLAHIDIYGQPEDGLSPSTTSHTMPKLKSHVSHNSADLVFRLMSKSPSTFSELSALSVWMRRSDEVSAAWTIMQSAATTLETLDIEDVSHFRYPTMIPGPVDIGVMTNLRRFKVNCRIASGDGVIFPMGIYGLLNSGTAFSTIENVQIAIDWVDCKIGTESRRFVEEPGWTALDEVLSGPKFRFLRNVLLTLKLGYGWRTTQISGNNPPQRVVALKDSILSLATNMFPQTSRIAMRKVNINLQIYKSRYALDVDD